ncbi:MAG: acetyl-CoA C-acyltransferase [Phycisphaerae bacterium]
MTKHAFIVAAKRSPAGRFLGGLSRLSAAAVGSQVAKALLSDAKVNPSTIDEVLIGQVVQAGAGQNPARQVALGAGIPDTVAACTINKVCGSGLKTVMFADQIIRAGDANLILAGGIESLSQAPFLVREMRNGHKYGNLSFIDSVQYDGLTNFYDNDLMGQIGEETAVRFGVTRRAQDEYAAASHQKAAKADAAGFFKAERCAIETRGAKAPFDADETIRPDATADALGILRPVFKEGGTITPGNASPLSDGVAVVLVASENGVANCGGLAMARIVASATSGGPPRELYIAPIKACKMVCEKAHWALRDVELWELNEAFATQSLVCLQGLEIDRERVNVNGGAIALGHPLGASGARVLTTLLHEMRRRKVKKGVASLCLGGGNAVALAVEAM